MPEENKFIQVLLPRPFDRAFEYAVPPEIIAGGGLKTGLKIGLKIGDYVTVPFGNRSMKGVVWDEGKSGEIDSSKIKEISEKSDLPPMSATTRKFIEWVADYTLAPVGSVLAMAISVPAALENREQKTGNRSQKPEAQNQVQLSGGQREAVGRLQEKITSGGYSTTLLDGVTGSGKTEVYFEAIRQVMQQGKQVVVLLPEIVLTTQLLQRFNRRFGFTPALWHSSLTPKQRRETWRSIALGDTRLVVGARSALFLPYQQLGLIVVDEEHEGAFKQEDGVIYHARDMAVVRANIGKIPIVLVSASPSIESLHNVELGKFDILHLPNRHGSALLPDIEVVDMREEKLDAQHFISSVLKEGLANALERGEQAMLFLNRRGYAPLTLCRKCGYRFQSPDSSSWMVLHMPPHRPPYLQCHHSGFTMQLPDKCPECGAEDSLAGCGPGVDRLQEEVREFLPQARIAVMTSDTVTSQKAAAAIVQDIEDGQVDVIIGTQMIAKGHHFPNLTLVGIVDADLGMEGGDLRAAEKSFQLLHQVAGRAGRESRKGTAIVQSYMPENAVIQALAGGNRDRFVASEMQRRKAAGLPPFSRLAGLVLAGKKEAEVKRAAAAVVAHAPVGKGVRVLGPAPAPMLLLRGNYRYRILVIADRNINIQKLLKSWLTNINLPSSIKLKIDIDPHSFM